MEAAASPRARRARPAANRPRSVWLAAPPGPGAADTVDGVKPTAPRLLLLGLAVLAAIGAGAPALAAGPARHSAGNSAVTDPLVLIGIPGLRWTDITARNAPALWRLASSGSVGSLVVSAVRTRTCPADGWLTLNSGARATAQPTAPAAGSARAGSAAPCPPLPRVVPGSAATGEAARIPAMPRLVTLNERFHYSPDWGLLARAAGPGGCVTAIGPGAALALAGPGGKVGSGGQAGSAADGGPGGQASLYLPSAAAAGRGGQVGSGGQAGSAAGPGAGGQASLYLPSAAAATRSVLNRCPLTVIDLGALPSGAGAGGAAARARARSIAAILDGALTVIVRIRSVTTVAV
jgi:hypothetical protein